MPERSFALEVGGLERLGVSWEGAFKDLTLTLDGRELGAFADKAELKAGKSFRLDDGSTLRVQLVQGLLPELQLTRDGDPLPGSPSDPAARVEAASNMIFAIAALNVLVGLLVEMTGAGFLRQIGAGWPAVVSGLFYVPLAVFVRRRSIVALGLAITLFAADGLFLLIQVARVGGTPPVAGIIARIFFLLPMLRAIPALRAPERPARRRPARPAAAERAVATPADRPLAGPPPAAAPAVQVRTGEAEKRRLQATQKVAAAPTTRMGRIPPEAAAQSLRFVAHRCEIGEGGIRATFPPARVVELPWEGIAGLAVRRLPPDAPWDGAIVVDLVPAARDGKSEPVRVYPTTFVNYAALPGGAPTSGLEKARRLAALIRQRSPAVAIDEATAGFLEGRPPAAVASMSQFADYDARYG